MISEKIKTIKQKPTTLLGYNMKDALMTPQELARHSPPLAQEVEKINSSVPLSL
jgi:hypothetical protein